MRTSFSRRMNACEPIWRPTGIKTREGPIHPAPPTLENKGKEPILMGESDISTTNYLPAALCSLTSHCPRTMQRLNPKNGRRSDPVDLSVARTARFKERLVETDAIRNWPPNMCSFYSGA